MFCGKGEAELGGGGGRGVGTYSELLQTDPDSFDAMQFFPVGCLDALFCLPLISESA